jgi:two-component system, cell cycle sensor histidine kinase and response regulator CckA
MATELRTHIASIGAGDHVCLLYEDTEELVEAAAELLGSGLRAGDFCLYVGDIGIGSRVVERLGEDAAGRALRVLPAEEAYLDGTGRLDARAAQETYARLARDARAAGHGGLRVVADTLWALGNPALLDQLVPYESDLASMVQPDIPLLAVCAYDRQRTPPAALYDALSAHPTVVVGLEVCLNPFYEPASVRKELDAEARLEWLLEQLRAIRANVDAMRAREETFRALADHAPDIIARFDLEGRHLYVNRKIEEVTGRSRDEFIGRTNRELGMPARLLKVWGDAAAQAIANREPRAVEFTFEGPNRVAYFESRFAPELDAAGQVTNVLCVTRDRTAEKEAVSATQRAEARYVRLFEAMAQGVVYQDTAGRMVDANPAALEILGITRAELDGRTNADPGWRAIRADGSPFPAREHPSLVALATGEEVNDVVMGIHNPVEDGHRWLLVHAWPERDTSGRIKGVFSTFTDVTTQRETEARLRASEERFRLMVEGSQEVFFYVHDREGRLEYVSPSIRTVLGYEPGEVVGRPYHEFVHPDDVSMVDQLTGATREAGGQMPSYRTRLIHKDGRIVVAEMTEAPVAVEEDVAGVHGFARDITHRTDAEEALAASERQLRAVLETSPVAIIMVDTARRVRLWNRAAESMFGWTAGEVLRGPYPIQAPPDEGEGPDHMFSRAEEGKVVHDARLRRLTRDGRVLELSFWNAVLHDRQGEQAGLIGIFVDNTERNRLEAELRQAHRIEAIGRLAGGVAHDFNNVLTSMLGHADLIMDTLAQDDPNRDDIEEIRRSADRARGLTRQLLAFSRKQMLTPRVLDLRVVVTETGRMLRRMIGEDVVLTTDLAPDLWPVRADRSQIEQVLMNLAVNARDAMPRGGAFTIRARNVHEGAGEGSRVRGPAVLLEISDTGTGIAPEVLPEVFDPFFTTKPAGVGTGLGLATVHGIVVQSGGEIRVATEVGKGTTFQIFLARSREAPSAPEAFEDTSVAPQPATVLLVEDEPAVRSLARRVLERKGFNVRSAASGAEAVEMATDPDAPIDIVLSDMVMPGMSGRECVDRVLTLWPEASVVLMSGYSAELLSGRGGIRAGEVFLEKPFTISALLAALGRAQGRER